MAVRADSGIATLAAKGAMQTSAARRCAAAVLAGLLFAGAAAAAPEPDFIGTWYVLIHYQSSEGPDPDRWHWEDRVWVIERSERGIEWVEHKIVTFETQVGRFENLGTPLARRLLGAWEPNEAQQAEIAAGLKVDSRGMFRKTLEGSASAGWQSTATEDVLRSADGLGFVQTWSIETTEAHPGFVQRSSIALRANVENSGITRYQIESRDRVDKTSPGKFQGEFEGEFEKDGVHLGRFTMRPTRILFHGKVRSRIGSTVEMIPDQSAKMNASMLALLLRPDHYYGAQRMTIDSTPEGAQIDIAYTRRGGQLLYRKGVAPMQLSLPTRLQTATADRLIVRASLPGHERAKEVFAVAGHPEELHFTLKPLENQITGVSHGYLESRTVIEIRSSEAPTLRQSEDASGYTLVFVRTAVADDFVQRLDGIADPLLSRVKVTPLAEDLLLRLELAQPADDEAPSHRLRHFVSADPVRKEHFTRLELVRTDALARRPERLLRAVESMDEGNLLQCTSAFEAPLLAGLDDGALYRALAPHQSAEGPILRAALRRYAAVRGEHEITTRSHEPVPTADPLELEMALTRAPEIDGYLAWLAALAGELAAPADELLVYRTLIAPSLAPEQFAELFAQATDAQHACLAALD